MHSNLPVIWALIIGAGVFIYVMLDGFDLGIGLLFPFIEDKTDRDVMLNTVAPVWDGNETFLILGGAGLFGAFPVVYSVLLPANYIPLVLMLVGLIFRGAAFELRAKSVRTRYLWDMAFILGSAQAALCQGIVLGSLLQGTKIVDFRFAGGSFDWLSPFSLFCGMGVLITYAMLGCGWLIFKTEGDLQDKMYQLMRPLTVALVVAMAIASLWTVIGLPAVEQRWFGSGDLVYFAPVPILVALTVIGVFWTVAKRHHLTPFLLTLFLVFLGFTGFVISIWPNIIPPNLTIWEASSPPSSQAFALVGVIIVLPVILTYSAVQYWVFRGKVRAGDPGYH